MCVKARGFTLRMTCKFHSHWTATTEVSVFGQYKLQTTLLSLIFGQLKFRDFDELLFFKVQSNLSVQRPL